MSKPMLTDQELKDILHKLDLASYNLELVVRKVDPGALDGRRNNLENAKDWLRDALRALGEDDGTRTYQAK